jgi:hypothetical protein
LGLPSRLLDFEISIPSGYKKNPRTNWLSSWLLITGLISGTKLNNQPSVVRTIGFDSN